MLISAISLTVIEEGPYQNSGHSNSSYRNSKKTVEDGVKSDNTTNNDELDAVHPRFNRQGHFTSPKTKRIHKTQASLGERCNSNQEGKLSIVVHHNVQSDKITLSNASPNENLIDDREVNILDVESNKSETKIPLCKKIKEFLMENPIVKMFTLIQWSLMKQPYFLITMIGSAFSFTALLNYFLLLPLLCKEVGLSEDKTSILLSATNASDVLFRLVFAWAGDWKCSKQLFCGKPRRMLYAISVFGVGLFMIGIST